MSWCKQCNEYMLYPSSHKCPPAWDCWQVDATEDDARKTHAHDAEAAAAVYAEKYDSDGDHAYANGGGELVLVRPHGTKEKPLCFEITAQPTVDYWANPATNPNDKPEISALPDSTQGQGA